MSFLLLVHGKNFEPVYSWAAVSHRGMFSVFTVPCFNSVNNRMLDESHSVTAQSVTLQVLQVVLYFTNEALSPTECRVYFNSYMLTQFFFLLLRA